MTNYYCEHCGAKDSSIQHLTSGQCVYHQGGTLKGKHKLYEGSEKSQYFCKYCGSKDSSIQHLTAGQCPKHPNGVLRGKHSPAL